MAGYSNAIYHTEQQKIIEIIFQKRHWREKRLKKRKKGHFAHIGNEIKICSQNKCHHHHSNVCENSFRMFRSNWVISDYHSFVWQFEFPWLNLTNCLFSRQWRFWNMIFLKISTATDKSIFLPSLQTNGTLHDLR